MVSIEDACFLDGEFFEDADGLFAGGEEARGRAEVQRTEMLVQSMVQLGVFEHLLEVFVRVHVGENLVDLADVRGRDRFEFFRDARDDRGDLFGDGRFFLCFWI